MTTWTAKPDPGADPLLGLLPFEAPGVRAAIASNLASTGHDTHCGQCKKPFTAARKRRGVARVTHIDAGVLCYTIWVLCGRCLAEMKRNGGKVSPLLMAEAREAAEAGLLALTPARGSA
ncbi:MAG: hypothetical protein AB1899_16905 [Pseudomonadota bacterium]